MDYDGLIFVLEGLFAAIERTAVLGGRLIVHQLLQRELIDQYLPKNFDETGTVLESLEDVAFCFLPNFLLVQGLVFIDDLNHIVLAKVIQPL